MLNGLRSDDHDRTEIRAEPVQSVDLAVFDVLGPGDVLFIDSTHVARTGGDVVHDVFEILPRLAPGVRVHFHDVFYPFEYPRDWVFEGRGLERALPPSGPALVQHPLPRRAVAIDARDRCIPIGSPPRLPMAMPYGGGSIWLEVR